MVERAMKRLETIEDARQEWKVKHKIIDIVMIVLFAMLAYADEWEMMEDFAYANEDFLRKYLELPNGIPSHDTINRVMGIIDSKTLSGIVAEWREAMNSDEGERLKKIISLDGKTIKGSASAKKKALHVVSAYSDSDGISLGQTVVDEKTNEIVAIPELLDEINVEGTIVTIDAMGTQTKIAEKIIKKKADYVLSLKANQGNLHKDVEEYFADDEFVEKIKKDGGYHRTVEKARGQIEIREYYQTEDIDWIPAKLEWKGLKSIGMVKTTTKKDDKVKEETRYFISSLLVLITLFALSVRGHWAIESMHWHLDVTFREDSNKTMDSTAAFNLNIIRKFALSILKLLDTGKKRSLKRKGYLICANSKKYLEKIINL